MQPEALTFVPNRIMLNGCNLIDNVNVDHGMKIRMDCGISIIGGNISAPLFGGGEHWYRTTWGLGHACAALPLLLAPLAIGKQEKPWRSSVHRIAFQWTEVE
jgi:hypothetical protein